MIGKDAAEPWVREATQGKYDLSPILAAPWTRVLLWDDRPVAAGGFADMGDSIAIAWALVARYVPRPLFVPLCRAYRRHLREAPFHRIEAHCVEGFDQSFRWVRCLGFTPDGGEFFTPDGRVFKRFVFRG